MNNDKRKKFQELTILDDFMFGVVMENEENCKGLLERILEMPIDHIEVDREKSFQYHPEYKGIRLDIFAKDGIGTRYNVEMQVRKTPIQKRSRYYHSQMDMDLLYTGVGYEELPDAYVIFVCDYDPFGGKLYRYTIENDCKEMKGLDVQDGSHTIILSNRGENAEEVPEELVQFLEYTKKRTDKDDGMIDNDFVRQIDNTIREIKKDRSVEERYMKLELILKEERREGIEEGRKEGKEEAICELVKQGDISLELGAQILSVSTEELRQLMEKYASDSTE